jgi:hypothetical protein
MLTRSSGEAMQSHMYSFASGATVKVKGAKVSLKADLGAYGAISLKAKKLGKARKGVVPRGCTGSTGKSRSGTLSGSFELAADTTYFQTIATRKLKAQVLKGGKLECGATPGGSPTARPATLSANLETPAGMLMFTATRDAGGAVTQQAMRMDDEATTAPGSIMHMITAPGGAAAFSPAADLLSATGSAITPFFSGAFTFSGENLGSMGMGTLTGDLAAKFDSIGTQQIAAGSPDAMLMPAQ